MRVLHVINSLSTGGAEKLLVDSVIYYRKLGLEVDILVLSDSDTIFKESLIRYPEIIVHSLGERINIYNPFLIFKLNKYFQDYDVIHVHLFPALYWVSLGRFLRFFRKPIILTEHSTDNKRRGSKILRFFDRFIYKQFTLIVTISDAASESLKKHLGCSFNNISTIDNGVNLETIYSASAYQKSHFKLKESDFIIIQVSSFRYPKDQKTVISALKQLSENTHLILVGDGPLKSENIEFSKNLGLSDRVHFLGLRNDVPKLLKSTDVIVLSSIYEGLSLSSVEGLASGRPFIASDAPGLRDVVKNAGLLFTPKDHEDLASKIKQLQEDEKYNKEIVKKCQERAENYDIKNMIEKYITLYQRILKK